jgi:hypothetical protein
MAVANGYGKVVTSGSVFMYDVGDTINSYRGEPTTNLINPNTVNIYSWWTRNVASIVQLSETYKGQPIYRVSISIDNGDMLYHITERWGAGSGWYMPYAIFNANTSYIASVIYRPISHPDTRIYGHPSNIGGWGATVDGNIDIDTQWKMHRIDRNFGATVGDNRFYHMHTPSAQIGQTIIVDITNSQIEQNNHVTPFVNGTRSATQGLLPIVGNSTINLSNVSFDSNAQIVFDGTDDFIDTDFPAITINNPTIEAVVYRNQSTGRYESIIQNNITSDDALYVYPGGNLGFWPCVASNLSVPTGQWSYVAVSYDGSNLTYCVNGVIQVVSATCADITDWDFLRIGAYGTGDGERWIGKISVAKVYDRALSSAEVKQNYNKYKTRFNLP